MVQNNKIIINSCDKNNIKQIVTPVKTYKWCEKCLTKLPEGSIIPFCSDFCRNEFYAENAREIDSVLREIRGID